MSTGEMGAPGDPKNKSIISILEISIGTVLLRDMDASAGQKEAPTTTSPFARPIGNERLLFFEKK